MAVRNIYLHIGRGKTGTTAIQSFLSVNREVLLAQDIHYILADSASRGRGHHGFAKSFIDQPPVYMEALGYAESARAVVRQELLQVKVETVLLSSENLTMANVEKLARFCEDLFGSATVRVIFFARSQDELAESEYNQTVKAALTRTTFEEFIATELEEMDFAELLAPWARRFGKDRILARVFDAAGHDVITDFLGCLGLATPLAGAAPAVETSANASAGFLALEMFHTLNQFHFSRRQGIYAQLNKAIKSADQPSLFFTSAQAQAFRDRYRSSNRAFSRDYLSSERDELGGRRYSDAERDRIIAAIRLLQGGD
jgi:hypothetical protein